MQPIEQLIQQRDHNLEKNIQSLIDAVPQQFRALQQQKFNNLKQNYYAARDDLLHTLYDI